MVSNDQMEIYPSLLQIQPFLLLTELHEYTGSNPGRSLTLVSISSGLHRLCCHVSSVQLMNSRHLNSCQHVASILTCVFEGVVWLFRLHHFNFSQQTLHNSADKACYVSFVSWKYNLRSIFVLLLTWINCNPSMNYTHFEVRIKLLIHSKTTTLRWTLGISKSFYNVSTHYGACDY